MNLIAALPERRSPKNRERLKVVGAALIALLLLGCNGQSPTAHTPADIRGEPINSPPRTNGGRPTLAGPATTNSSANPSAAAPVVEQTSKGEKYQTVGFDKLAGFNFEISENLLNPQTNQTSTATVTNDQIPTAVRELDKKRIALTGFMLPLKVEGGAVTELLIMKDQSMCCYGVVPKINEWVSVKMVGSGIKPVMDQPVTLFGTLHVGEMRENGYLVGIYNLDGESMSGPLDN